MSTNMNNLKALLSQLPMSPKLHVNGDGHPTALLTVDFGQPKVTEDLSSAQVSDLNAFMKSAARELTNRRGNIKISRDSRGMYWASLVH